MTNQDAYEKIREHFTRPGAELAKHGLTCSYRMSTEPSDPTRCPVGVLIPDDLYDAGYEGNGVESLVDEYDVSFGDVSVEFLSEVQTAHDEEAETVPHFLLRLNEIAPNYGVEVAS